MKQKTKKPRVKEISEWANLYRIALHRYLKAEPSSNLVPARKLGHDAITLGMEILDVAKIHAAATASPEASEETQKTKDSAGQFFAETVGVIEQTHAPELNADKRINELTQTLRKRAREASSASRQAQRGIAQRQEAEAALRKSALRRANLLKEAYHLQELLQRMTRELLSEQEHERTKTGDQLRNETAQTLLAIHIRLLGLKKAATDNTKILQKVIDEAREMVQNFVEDSQLVCKSEDNNEK